MKTLYEYINESILKGQDTTLQVGSYDAACIAIDDFISKNYNISKKYKIKKRPNKEGKYIVDFGKNSTVALLPNATSFTNDVFVMGYCETFIIQKNANITNLVGTPETVTKLAIENCPNFNSFEGMPEFVYIPKGYHPTLIIVNMGLTDLMSLDKHLNVHEKMGLDIRTCNRLTSLKGCPKTLNDLSITWCDALKDLSDGPTTLNRKLEITCCKGFSSLNGCPENIGDGEWAAALELRDCDNIKHLTGCGKNINAPIRLHGCKNIESLEGLPKHIKGDLYIHVSDISTLEGCPEVVDGRFTVDLCGNLTSLEGCPKKVGSFNVERCHNLNVTEEDIKALCKTDDIRIWASGRQ